LWSIKSGYGQYKNFPPRFARRMFPPKQNFCTSTVTLIHTVCISLLLSLLTVIHGIDKSISKIAVVRKCAPMSNTEASLSLNQLLHSLSSRARARARARLGLGNNSILTERIIIPQRRQMADSNGGKWQRLQRRQRRQWLGQKIGKDSNQQR
jgi:hypothetical protein